MNSQLSDEEIRERRRQRVAQARRRRKKKQLISRLVRKFSPVIAGVVVLLVLAAAGKILLNRPSDEVRAGQDTTENASTAQESGQTGREEEAGNGAGQKDGISGAGQGEDGVGEPAGAGDGGNAVSQTGAEAGGSSEGDPAGAGGSNGNPAGAGENGGSKAAGAQGGGSGNGAGMQPPAANNPPAFSAHTTQETLELGGDIVSSHAVLIDLASGSILAQKDYQSRISPASMTKILTILVAAEHVTNLDDTFTITLDITDYSYVNDCSNVGFEENETVSVRDLFYGTILPSGADAAAGLAVYVAGSREAFVDMMNAKLAELGLSDTAHFTNCVGLYDENHYCTVYDMAVILEAALQNDLCREVLSAHTYTTSATEQHPEGMLLSNWFLRRIEDKDTGGEVIGGKTGYVVQSGNCAASYAVDANGKEFICVTANASSAWRCIYDHVALYKQFSTEEAATGNP